MCADHFELGTFKDDQLHTNILPGFCLDFHSADESKIGICVHPKETFVYKPKKGHALYLFEVGLPKYQAESVVTEIKIYLKASCGKDGHKRILIGHLSKQHARFRLGMVLPAEIELSHSAARRNVYFNALELKKKRVITVQNEIKRCPEISYHMKNTNKHMWVAKVKPSQELEFRPSAEGKIYNLLKVFSATRSKKKEIQLFVESKGVRKLLGTVSNGNPSIDCEFQFIDTFSLSHSSRATVFFWGYTVSCDRSSWFKLEDLTDDPSPFFLRQPPKEVVDGEHNAYQALLAKKKTGANIRQVNLVPMIAPVIRAGGALA
ncbi:hypothetical protein ACQ4PT_057867 [Festuca glaucescens]